MENNTFTNHENGNEANRLLGTVFIIMENFATKNQEELIKEKQGGQITCPLCNEHISWYKAL